jgi:hypothetical protein
MTLAEGIIKQVDLCQPTSRLLEKSGTIPYKYRNRKKRG